MAKTGYPTAIIVAEHAYKYMTRNQARLNLTITPTQASALAALVLCLGQFLVAFTKPTINP